MTLKIDGSTTCTNTGTAGAQTWIPLVSYSSVTAGTTINTYYVIASGTGTSRTYALSAAELRVARLAAEGLTNREIAQALFVTTKTAKAHLSSVYRKPEITRRGQLADALPDVLNDGREDPAATWTIFSWDLARQEIGPVGPMRDHSRSGDTRCMHITTPTQRVILDAAIERSVIRDTLTAPAGERREFHGWLELNTALEAILDLQAERCAHPRERRNKGPFQGELVTSYDCDFLVVGNGFGGG